jgi:hypothetical protein
MYSPEQRVLGVSEVCEAGLQPIVVLKPNKIKEKTPKYPLFNLLLI